MPHRDTDQSPALGAVAVVGDGCMGRAVAGALRTAGINVRGPLGRGAAPGDASAELLAVPDAEIAAAADAVVAGPLVGHFCGATTLQTFAAHEAFGIHPRTEVTDATTSFAGAPAAVAAATPRGRKVAEAVARTLGMTPFRVASADRAVYHAAASSASNFVVTLEAFAEESAATAGVDRAALGPIVRATVDNWQAHGASLARSRAAKRRRSPGSERRWPNECRGSWRSSTRSRPPCASSPVPAPEQETRRRRRDRRAHRGDPRAELRGRRGGRIALVHTKGTSC